MSRVNNRRRRKKTSQKEQNFSDLQAVKVLIEILVKERVEKKVYESKQQLEAAGKHVLESALVVQDVTEKIGADIYLPEINVLIQRVEDKAKQIDEEFDKVSAFPETVTLDKHLLASERVGISKDVEMLIQEMELFFTQAAGEIIILSRKNIQYVLDKNKQARDEIAQGIIDFLSSIRSQGEQLTVDEQLLTHIDILEKEIVRSQITLDAETADLIQLLEEPGADIPLVYSETQRILSLLVNFHEQIDEELERLNDELEPLRQRRRLRRQRQQLSATMKVLLIDATLYLLWSVPQGMFRPQANALFAFLITGLILTVITFKATAILVTFEGDHPALFNVTQSPFLNRLIMHTISAVVMFLLIIFNYTIVLYFLYLFLYSFSNYLDTINLYLTLIVNSVAIVGLLIGLLKLLKQFDLRGNVKHLYSMLSGR